MHHFQSLLLLIVWIGWSSASLSDAPTVAPSDMPTMVPTVSFVPTMAPSMAPTTVPTFSPTMNPTAAPSMAPSNAPTFLPTEGPTIIPSLIPTTAPSIAPSDLPTMMPTMCPTAVPSMAPSVAPSIGPTMAPSVGPTIAPSAVPTPAPTLSPTAQPTPSPTGAPFITAPPTVVPTLAPTGAPTMGPTFAPSMAPTTISPTLVPTLAPTMTPSLGPTLAPTMGPTLSPTAGPTPFVSFAPTRLPTPDPTVSRVPTLVPTGTPTLTPTTKPTALPSIVPTRTPTLTPTFKPTTVPTIKPTAEPTAEPTVDPTTAPTAAPTVAPTEAPTPGPSRSPTSPPTTLLPTRSPTRRPSQRPSSRPSSHPTYYPTSKIQTPFTFASTTLISSALQPTMDSAAVAAFTSTVASTIGALQKNVIVGTIITSPRTVRRRLSSGEELLRHLRAKRPEAVVYDYSIYWTTVVILEERGFDSPSDAFSTLSSRMTTACTNGAFAASLESLDPTTYTGVSVTNQAINLVPTFAPTKKPESNFQSYFIAVIVLAILFACVICCIVMTCVYRCSEKDENGDVVHRWGWSSYSPADERSTRPQVVSERSKQIAIEKQAQRKQRMLEEADYLKGINQKLATKRDATKTAPTKIKKRLDTVRTKREAKRAERAAATTNRGGGGGGGGDDDEDSDARAAPPSPLNKFRSPSPGIFLESDKNLMGEVDEDALDQSSLQYKFNFLLQANKAQRLACGLTVRVFTPEMNYYMLTDTQLTRRELNRLWNYVSILEEENHTLADIIDKMSGVEQQEVFPVRAASQSIRGGPTRGGAGGGARPQFSRQFSGDEADSASVEMQQVRPSALRSPLARQPSGGASQENPVAALSGGSQRGAFAAVRQDYQYSDIYTGGEASSSAAKARFTSSSPLRASQQEQTPFQGIFNAPRQEGSGQPGPGSQPLPATPAGPGAVTGSSTIDSSTTMTPPPAPMSPNVSLNRRGQGTMGRLQSRRLRMAEQKGEDV